MKILKNVTNLGNITPIGGQYPIEMTESGEGLSHDVPVNTEVNILPSKKSDVPTLPFTDATMIFVDDRKSIAKCTASTAMKDVYNNVLTKKARPYCLSHGQVFYPILGATEQRLKDHDGTYTDRLLADELDTYLGVSIESKGSTILASYVRAIENMNVKVQNAFNRPLPFNTWTEEERFAALYNYHARLFQLLLVFDTISGMVSFVYDKSTSAAISTKGISSLYSPTLFAKLQEAYNSIKQFPVLDTYAASVIQKYSKIYSATEKVYFPGGYHQIIGIVSIGNMDGSFGTGTNAMQFDGTSSLGHVTAGYKGRMTTAGIHTWVNTNTLEEKLSQIASVANALTLQFSKVIQFCIQATAKGIYTFKPLDDFIDFDDNGLYIYEIEKDYHINNFIRNIPLRLKYEDGSTNKNTVVSPISYLAAESPLTRVFDGYNRYVNPYCLKDNVYTTYELLSSKVWEINKEDDYYEDAVTGLGVQLWVHGNTSNGTRVWYSTGSMVEFPLVVYNNTDLLADATESTSQLVISDVPTDDVNALSTAVARINEIIDQFDLLYLAVPDAANAGSRDADLLITDLEEDSYFFELSDSALATPNADVYSSLMELITWLDPTFSQKKSHKSYDNDRKTSVDHKAGENKS